MLEEVDRQPKHRQSLTKHTKGTYFRLIRSQGTAPRTCHLWWLGTLPS